MIESEWIGYKCKSGQTIFLCNKVTGVHKWPPGYDDGAKERIVYVKQDNVTKAHCIAIQTDDYGCSNGYTSMYINTDPVHETLLQPQPGVTVDSQHDTEHNQENNFDKKQLICEDNGEDDWIKYKCKSGQTIFLYNKVTGVHKWPPGESDDTSQENVIHGQPVHIKVLRNIATQTDYCKWGNGCTCVYRKENLQCGPSIASSNAASRPEICVLVQSETNNNCTHNQKNNDDEEKMDTSVQNKACSSPDKCKDHGRKTPHKDCNEEESSFEYAQHFIEHAQQTPYSTRDEFEYQSPTLGENDNEEENFVEKQTSYSTTNECEGQGETLEEDANEEENFVEHAQQKPYSTPDECKDHGETLVEDEIDMMLRALEEIELPPVDYTAEKDSDSSEQNKDESNDETSQQDKTMSLKCTHCLKKSEYKVKLKNNTKRSLKCFHCKKTFTHKETSPRKKHECPHCLKKLATKACLTRHLRIHTNEKPFECSECKRKFSQKESMKRHLLTHTKEKPFECSYCKKRFAQNSALKGHIRTHTKIHINNKPYECSFCAKTFSLKVSLKSHLTTHTNQKPYECSYCSKTFAQQRSLKRHIRIHTNEKPFECSYCGKKFRIKDTLTHHIRTHTKEKPYECSYCQQKFAQNTALKMHIRTHTNEKPYECSYCERRFTCKARLTGHTRTHTKEKPFECHYCLKKFALRGGLSKHLKVHLQK